MTAGELRRRLALRAARRGDVAEVVAKLQQKGYLDDRRFAETFARLRVENQGFGKFRVLRDLKGRRVPAVLAQAAVTQAYREVDENQLIEQYIERKLRPRITKEADVSYSRLASFYRALLRAGFSSDRIRESLRKLSVPSEWVDGLESLEEEVSD